MTDGINYLSQLQISSTSLRLTVPDLISQAVVNKIMLLQDRSEHKLPENIIYCTSIDELKFQSPVHLANVRLSGWQIKIVNATEKSLNNDVMIAIIHKVGSVKTRTAVSDHHNGNNPVRARSIRK